MHTVLETLADFGFGLLKVSLHAFFLIALWSLINKLTTAYDDHDEMFVKGNTPLTIRRSAIIVAQAFAISPLLSGGSDLSSFLWLIGGGLVITGIFSTVRMLIERLIHQEKSNVNKATISTSVSIVEAGYYLSLGLIIGAALSGSAPSLNLVEIIGVTVLFAVLGFVVLYVTYSIAGARAQLHHEVKQNNLAASLAASGLLVALGIGIQSGIAGDFKSMGSSLTGFSLAVAFVFVALVLATWAVNRFMLHTSLHTIVKNGLPNFTLTVSPKDHDETADQALVRFKNCVNHLMVFVSSLLAVGIGVGSVYL